MRQLYEAMPLRGNSSTRRKLYEKDALRGDISTRKPTGGRAKTNRGVRPALKDTALRGERCTKRKLYEEEEAPR